MRFLKGRIVRQIKPFPKNKTCPKCGSYNLSEDGGMGIMCYDCDEFVYNWGASFADNKNPYKGFDYDPWEDVTPWYWKLINKARGILCRE